MCRCVVLHVCRWGDYAHVEPRFPSKMQCGHPGRAPHAMTDMVAGFRGAPNCGGKREVKDEKTGQRCGDWKASPNCLHFLWVVMEARGAQGPQPATLWTGRGLCPPPSSIISYLILHLELPGNCTISAPSLCKNYLPKVWSRHGCRGFSSRKWHGRASDCLGRQPRCATNRMVGPGGLALRWRLKKPPLCALAGRAPRCRRTPPAVACASRVARARGLAVCCSPFACSARECFVRSPFRFQGLSLSMRFFSAAGQVSLRLGLGEGGRAAKRTGGRSGYAPGAGRLYADFVVTGRSLITRGGRRRVEALPPPKAAPAPTGGGLALFDWQTTRKPLYLTTAWLERHGWLERRRRRRGSACVEMCAWACPCRHRAKCFGISFPFHFAGGSACVDVWFCQCRGSGLLSSRGASATVEGGF